MKRRRHGQGSHDESMETRELPQRQAGQRNRHRPLLLSLFLLIIAAFLIVGAIVFYQFWWPGFYRDRSALAVFSKCRSELHVQEIDDTSPPCVYFRPSNYFFDVDQPGYRYKDLIYLAAVNIRLTMWGKQVSDFGDTSYSSRPHEFLLRQGVSSVSAIMMPKVASRSIHSLFFERLSVQTKHNNERLSSIMDIHTGVQAPRVAAAEASFWKKLSQRQEKYYTYGNHFFFRKDIVFCLLRDPISRILSSLAQTLSVPMQRKCESCARIMKPCVATSNTYKELIQCAISSMMKGEHYDRYFDVHVVPQAVFLAASLQQNDVEVAVFSMEHGGLDSVLRAFGASDQHKNKRNEKEFEQVVIERFGDELFDPQKAREALDDAMIADICKLYEVDVLMMRYLGWSVSDCE